MSQFTLNRIRKNLEDQFTGKIDMSDWARHAEDERRKAFLSRALAALCVRQMAGVSADEAAGAVTDEPNDNGLDAVHFNARTDTLLLIQSKWSDAGNAPIDAAGVGKFTNGVRDLLGDRFDRFYGKALKKAPEVKTALYADRQIRIRLVTIHSATQPTDPFVARSVNDLVDELNDPVQIAAAEHLDQAGAYRLITASSAPEKIKLQVGLTEWGEIARPFLGYYGYVHVGEIANWWKEHGNSLFQQNLRLFYYSSDINDALKKTLAYEPEYFWYFNNGITVICDDVHRGLAGAPQRHVGLFTCNGVSVVNGAQTVGSIGEIVGAIPAGTDPPQAWVQVRIISLEKTPPEFSRRITRAANLQNAVGNREFAAMDPLQFRLATDFMLDKRKYVYKSGDHEPRGDEGCSIVETTQALGCALSVSLAVQVKREIGALWADTDSPPYTEIFPADLTTTRVWRCVSVMRAVDEELQRLKTRDFPRAELVAIHMNRIILHLVFQDPSVSALNHDGAADADVVRAARGAVGTVFQLVADYIEREHANEYPAALSKNLTKCERLATNYRNPTPPKQGSLPLGDPPEGIT